VNDVQLMASDLRETLARMLGIWAVGATWRCYWPVMVRAMADSSDGDPMWPSWVGRA